MIKAISEKLREVNQHPYEAISSLVKPFKGHIETNTLHHHFLTFLKPEILSLQQGINIEAVLDFVFEHYQRWNIRIEGIRILSGSYLRQHHIISKNYETLHKISYNGLDACSESVKYKLNKEFRNYIKPFTRILGGHEFLKINPELTPNSLNKMISHLNTNKLGSGAYAVYFEYKDNSHVLLNAFHPHQVESLTKSGDSIIALECYSNHPWTILRHDFVGTIYPQQSKKGSFRRELFEKKDSLHIEIVDISHNGLHISPGPIEAAFQLLSFFTEESNFNSLISQMSIFRKLLNKNISKEKIFNLRENPHLKKDETSFTSPLFECTEDMNAEEAQNFIEKNMMNGLYDY